MKRWLAWLVLGLYLAVGTVAWAAPAIPPAPGSNIYVQDYAGVLSGETKNRLNAVGSQLAAKTKAQIVVVTVKTLDNMPMDEYALAILRQWGVGDKQLNNGVVMVIAIDDRKSRIEVGYGLEGALPDSKVGRIQDEHMLPYFKQGTYDRGIYNGYMALAGEVAREYKVELKTEGTKGTHTVTQESWWDSLPGWMKIAAMVGLGILFVLDWMFFGGTITYLLLSLLRFRGGGGGGGSGGRYGGGSGGGGGASRNW